MEDALKNAEKLMKEGPKPNIPSPKDIEKAKKEIEQLKEKLESFKKGILKKFPYIVSISLILPDASKIFDEEIEKENKEEKKMHLYILVPDEKEKEYSKIKVEAIKLVGGIKPKVWINVALVKDLWEICYDGKNELMDAIAASIPLHDKGLLGSLRVANIHKIMCLKKFENYIVSYVIAGSLVRGEATKTSDVDIYVIVDDTDVKRMSRLELKERLRQMIYSYAIEAGDYAGVKNKLNPQIYILTDFWEGIRESQPIFFTFVRDGIPLYDKGTFRPWKLLLKMGKITGTPEAIEKFLASGERIREDVKRRLLDIATGDLYWSVITPSQGALMLYGLAPPTHKETVELMRKVFYEKEKLLEKEYIDFIEHVIIDIYKGYEHGKVKEISGKEIDELSKKAEDYVRRLRKLAEEIGKRTSEKTLVQMHEDILSLLQSIFGKGSEKILAKKFKEELIEKGKVAPSSFRILKEVCKVKKDFDRKKDSISRHEVERIRKDAYQLMAALTEYSQRDKMFEIAKIKFQISVEGKEGDLFLLGHKAFVVLDVKSEKPEVKSIDLEKNMILSSEMPELQEALKKPVKGKLNQEVLKTIERLLGKKVEIVL